MSSDILSPQIPLTHLPFGGHMVFSVDTEEMRVLARHLNDLADETNSFVVSNYSDSRALGFHELVDAYNLFRNRAESSRESAHNWFHKTAVAVSDTTRHIKEKDEQWADEFAAVEIHLAPLTVLIHR